MLFITKKRIAKEIAKIYECTKQVKGDTPEVFLTKCEVASKLNLLCDRLNIKPAHLNKLGGGTLK